MTSSSIIGEVAGGQGNPERGKERRCTDLPAEGAVIAKRKKWREGTEGEGNPERGKGRRCTDLSADTQKGKRAGPMGGKMMTGATIPSADSVMYLRDSKGGIMMTGTVTGADRMMYLIKRSL